MSLVHTENQPLASVEQPDKPHARRTTKLKQDGISSPRANRARAKIKYLIKPVESQTSPPTLSVDSLDVTDRINISIPSKRAAEDETVAGFSVPQLKVSESRYGENVASEQAHEVQKGWEDNGRVTQKKVSKDRKGEGSKQAQSKWRHCISVLPSF